MTENSNIKPCEKIESRTMQQDTFKEEALYLLNIVENKSIQEVKAEAEQIKNVLKLFLVNDPPSFFYIKDRFFGIIIRQLAELLEFIPGLDKTAKLARMVYDKTRKHVLEGFFGRNDERREVELIKRKIKEMQKKMIRKKVIRPIIQGDHSVDESAEVIIE